MCFNCLARRLFPLLIVLMVLLLVLSASAQTVAPAVTTVDLAPLVQILLSFLSVVLPAIAGYIAWVVKQRMNIAQGSADAQLVDSAAKRAGGLAYSFLTKQASNVPQTVEVRNAALATGMNHMISAVPDAMQRLGVNDAGMKRMVDGELGKLEAADPSIPIPPPAVTNPPAPIPVVSVTAKPAS